MIARPCAGCGEVIAAGSWCRDCRPQRADTPPRDHPAYANGARWKALSKRIRKASPFCEQCGSGDRLQVDHVVPHGVAPELAFAEENLRVLCALDNNRRQNTYTHDEAQHVLDRLTAAYNRRPTRKGRERIAAAERACDQGGYPEPVRVPTAGKAHRAMKTTMIVDKRVPDAVG
ncbi:HNH endonuclease signature motif containing protein [[Mycobacterium] burgundiense]|uniref:HNH endonuclease signature motif containing protein n=1 Tax=[Mycobacterium] burgundiense TaxID=3064286 RepID=A0ABM9LW30_9MYCO|nr:HNH endonuclease signature motif containing protein [Mycolicibacterium sp. MU0053]CAJ1505680.1 HNH endonuclease signature motif containing protein [Mycolicibacterium sp. MU0053]